MSRIDLDVSNGLILMSNNNQSIKVQGQTIVVPKEPMPGNGSLLTVRWQPPAGTCSGKTPGIGKYATKDVHVQVTPPAADKVIAKISHEFLVCVDDIASAAGANYPTADQIAVSLQYPSKTVSNLAGDPRTVYTVPPDAPFTVDRKGRITANKNGDVGEAQVRVSFKGENVTANVIVRVEKFKALVIKATPWPIYPGSAEYDVKKLSVYACSSPPKHEQAVLGVRMQLTNKKEKSIPSKYLTFDASESIVVIGADGLVTANKKGAVNIGATFEKEAALVKLPMAISDALVTVTKLVSFRAGRLGNPYSGGAISTLSGRKDVYRAQLSMGAMISNGRQYPRLFANDGTPEIPGLVTFSSELSSKLRVDNKKGALTLLSNHHSSIRVEAQTCADNKPVARDTIQLFCNLQPATIGDVDIGNVGAAPINAVKVGQTFVVPVRVNTGERLLRYFRVNVNFDKTAVSVKSVKHSIAQSDGSVNFQDVRIFLCYT